MTFIREVYEQEILPSLKQLVISIVRGVKGLFSKIFHVIENPWSSFTGVISQKDDISKAFDSSDWLSFCQGVLLVLGALAIYDSPIKNWGVVKEATNGLKNKVVPPTPLPIIADTVAHDVAIAEDLPEEEPRESQAIVPTSDQQKPKLPYEDRIEINKANFIDKVHEVAFRLKIKPSWLMIAIWIESTFNRGIVNKYSGTVGLIQWTITNVCKFWHLPKPHVHLDKKGRIILTSEIKRIHNVVKNTSGVEQLEKIYEYFEPYIGKMHSVYDVYLAIFYPYAMNKSNDFVLGSEKSVSWMRKVYAGNKALDMFGDRDGLLEVLDVKAWVDAHVPLNFRGKL